MKRTHLLTMRTARRSIAHGSILQTAKESTLTLIHSTLTQRFQNFLRTNSFLSFFIAIKKIVGLLSRWYSSQPFRR